jgi:23S rRNA pseudouridine1911/1915/1917 synthase
MVRFDVLFEDEHLIVIDKPAGLVVHPARGHADETLVNGLVARYGWDWQGSEPSDPTDAIRPGIVHRIDKDTSGVLVVARGVRAREGLKEQLAAHEMGRKYLALTVGVPMATTIRTFYGRHPRSRLRFTSLVAEGKRAVTHVQAIERFSNACAALVQCQLETGRTHQIRVHLAEQTKTPLLADQLYGTQSKSPTVLQAEHLIGRQALHAAQLAFIHPITGEALSFQSDLPADFRSALEYLRRLDTE